MIIGTGEGRWSIGRHLMVAVTGKGWGGKELMKFLEPLDGN